MKDLINSKSIKSLFAHAKLLMAVEKYLKNNPSDVVEGNYPVYIVKNGAVRVENYDSYLKALGVLECYKNGAMLNEDGRGYVARINGKWFEINLPFDFLDGED